MTEPILLADIGGTNARFALLRNGECGPIERLPVAGHRDAETAIAAFLARQGGAAPRAAVLGVAGTVEGGRCEIVNSGWQIDGERLRAAFGFDAIRVLNDFEALAWALPRLGGADLMPVGGGMAVAGAPMVVLGPGTGFGAACLLPRPGGAVAIGTEAGHATLPAATAREDAAIDHLRRRHGHVSVERALSGPGLENLHDALAAIDGVTVPRRDAAAIVAAAQAQTCPVSREAFAMFCAMLGTVAGNLALTFRARGGVFIAGGMAPRFAADLANSEYRARFAAKGRYRTYLEAIPSAVILRPDAAFVGLQAVAEHVDSAAA